jgi:hypothetical protein
MTLQEYINLINKAESIEQFCIDSKLKLASTDDGKYSGILFALRQNKTTAILGVQKHLTK